MGTLIRVEPLQVYVEVVFEVGELHIEAPQLHVAVSRADSLIFGLNFSYDVVSVCFQLCLLVVVMVVLLYFYEGSRVVECTHHFS